MKKKGIIIVGAVAAVFIVSMIIISIIISLPSSNSKALPKEVHGTYIGEFATEGTIELPLEALGYGGAVIIINEDSIYFNLAGSEGTTTYEVVNVNEDEGSWSITADALDDIVIMVYADGTLVLGYDDIAIFYEKGGNNV